MESFNNIQKQIMGWFKPSAIKHISYKKSGVRPQRDWHIILIITFLLLLINGSVGYYIYVQINEGGFFTVDQPDTGNNVTFNAKLFEKTLSDINARQTQAQALKDHPIAIPDPSL